jgi:hypothetical protein
MMWATLRFIAGRQAVLIVLRYESLGQLSVRRSRQRSRTAEGKSSHSKLRHACDVQTHGVFGRSEEVESE